MLINYAEPGYLVETLAWYVLLTSCLINQICFKIGVTSVHLLAAMNGGDREGRER